MKTNKTNKTNENSNIVGNQINELKGGKTKMEANEQNRGFQVMYGWDGDSAEISGGPGYLAITAGESQYLVGGDRNYQNGTITGEVYKVVRELGEERVLTTRVTRPDLVSVLNEKLDQKIHLEEFERSSTQNEESWITREMDSVGLSD